MLSLLTPSNAQWASAAVKALDRVLVDHAHCEMKAASNAISLSTRALKHPQVMRGLCEIAEEELRHFRMVLDLLVARGLELGTPPPDLYAAQLLLRANQTAIHRGADSSLVDRLLVGAMIEARSCERFKLLAGELRRRHLEPELAIFYEELLASEARHHRTFLDLAIAVSGKPERVKERHSQLAGLEAEILSSLTNETTIHG